MTRRPVIAWKAGSSILLVLISTGLLLLMGSAYLATQHTITVEVNGTPLQHRTHAWAATGILREMGLRLQAEDLLEAPGQEDLRGGAPIRVTIAHRVLLVHDGSLTVLSTQAETMGAVLAEMQVTLGPNDQLLWHDQPCPPETPLPEAPQLPGLGVGALLTTLRQPVRLSVRRAVSLSVQDGTVLVPLCTAARTVGEALYERGLIVYAGDRVRPGLETPISPGMTVVVERSKPLTLNIAGQRQVLRTRLKTVADVLQAQGVTLRPKDVVVPDLQSPIARDLHVTVLRVDDEYYVEEVPIPYEARWEASNEVEIDDTAVRSWGHEGARRTLVRVHYENDRERYRVEEDEWIARDPEDRVYLYGTKIVLRTVDTASGPLTYWRKVRMYATSYSPSTAGTAKSSPWFGKTRLGLVATRGIVAVDPRLVPLGSYVYVPGYGKAIAGDTGGAIKNKRVDLCYDDDTLEWWAGWVDVYLLAPAPPAYVIMWQLPNIPKEQG